MERSKKFVLGIDVGGSKIRGVLHNGKKALRFLEISTPKTKKQFEKSIRKISVQLAAGDEINYIGIAVAGVVEGMIINESPNIKYLKNFDFKKLKLAQNIKVDNDARAFLKAETVRHRVSDRVLGITVGTGIGRAFFVNGKIKKIKQFEYPEKWEWEYQKIRDQKNNAGLANFLGIKLSPIIKKYKPGVVVLGGGVMERKKFFEKMEKRLPTCAGKPIKVMCARLHNKAGAYGAAMLWR